MTDKVNDELRDLWARSPSGSLNGYEVIALVQKDVQRRDLLKVVYILAAVLYVPLMALFIFMAVVGSQNTLDRIGSICLAASCGSFSFYLLRYGPAAIAVDPDQNLAAYTHASVERCDHQIRFFKSIKYVCLLPFSMGTLMSKAGTLMYRAKSGPLRRIDITGVAIPILALGLIWLMYHIIVPWATRKQRDKLLAMIGEKDQQQIPADGTLPECG
jgi:hypothetical protein